MSHATLVGRFAQLDALAGALKDARNGRGTTVLLPGDPGAGKTRLAAETVTQAEQLGFRVFYARAHEFEPSLPYAATARLLDRAIRDLGSTRVAALTGPGWPALSMIFPSVPAADESGADLRAQAQVLLARLLAAWAEAQPLLLVIDDAHWADQATLELAQVLADRLRDTRSLLVLAYRDRPPELSASRAVFFDRLASGSDAALVIPVSPLDAADCQALTSELVGGIASSLLAEWVHGVTGGNPFFVEETVRTLVESHAIQISDGHAELKPQLDPVTPSPATIRSAVFSRVLALGDEAMQVARAVSVLGAVDLAKPHFGALLDATDLARDKAEAALDDLVRAGVFVARDDIVEFAHPIVSALVYDDLGPVERRRLHARVATAMRLQADSGAPISRLEIAVHVAESATMGDDAAVTDLLAAGDETATRAPGVAADWYARAAELAAPGPGRAEIQARQARALLLSDSLTETVQVAAEAAAGLLPGFARSSAVCLAATALTALGRVNDALQLIDDTLGMDAADGLGRLLAHRCSVLMFAQRLTEARDAGLAALEHIGGDASARVLAHRELAQVAALTGDFSAQRHHIDEAMAGVTVLPFSAETLLFALNAVHLIWMGELVDAERMLRHAESLCRDHGASGYQPIVDNGLALLTWLRGDWAAAETHAQAAFAEAQRSGRVLGSAWISPALTAMAIDRGDVTTARRLLAQVDKDQDSGGYHLYGHIFASQRGRLAILTGSPALAVDTLEQALDATRQAGVVLGRHLLLSELAVGLLQIGDTARAQAVAEELQALASLLRLPILSAYADRVHLLVADDVTAGARAADAFTAENMPFDAAVTSLLLAERAESSALLTDAYRAFETFGADPWRRRSAAALKRLGQPVPRRRRSPRATDLSPLEADIAKLVVAGLSNRQIATALSISVRTVESYLTRIYQRVGVSSRTEFVAAQNER